MVLLVPVIAVLVLALLPASCVPVPEELKAENCEQKEFLKEFKKYHFPDPRNPYIHKWGHRGSTKFLVGPSTFKHSNSNPYRSNKRKNLARAALYHLDKLLRNMAYDKELEPKPETGVTNVYRYLANVSAHQYGPETFQIIVKRRNDITLEKKRKHLASSDVVYDVLNIAGMGMDDEESWAGTSPAPSQQEPYDQHRTTKFGSPNNPSRKPYLSNGEKSREVQKRR